MNIKYVSMRFPHPPLWGMMRRVAPERKENRSVDIDLFKIRSLLFLPASNPRAIEKARSAGSDLVILDLEDAVRPADKDAARDAAVEAIASQWGMPVAVRVNGFGSAWHELDLAAVAGSAVDAIIVPDVRQPEHLDPIRAPGGRLVIAMIESAQGVLAAPSIAKRASALMVGTNDLANDLRLSRSSGRAGLQFALQSVVLAARAAGIPVFDGVFNALEDEDGFAAECGQGRALGFDGKSLIHPRQIATCHAVFSASTDEIARAKRLVAAATGGAERFEGEMIEQMHVDAAKRLIEQTLR
ncbi:MAG TPA: CoA ester lyase [Sphingomicrobium sp.]